MSTNSKRRFAIEDDLKLPQRKDTKFYSTCMYNLDWNTVMYAGLELAEPELMSDTNDADPVPDGVDM